MNHAEFSCPSCGVILEFKGIGMYRCKYCEERLYIEHGEDGISVILCSEEPTGRYDDLEEGEIKGSPEAFNEWKENRKVGPISFLLILIIIGFALSPLLKVFQFSPKPQINQVPPRKEAPKVKKQFAAEVTSMYMKHFVRRAFEKETEQIDRTDYERVRYLKVWKPEYDSMYFIVDYALDEFDAFDEAGALDKRKIEGDKNIRQIKIFLENDEPFVLPLYDFQSFTKLKVLDLENSRSLIDMSGFEEEYEFHLKSLEDLQALFLPDFSRIERVNEIITAPERLIALSGGIYDASLLETILYRFENLKYLEISYINDDSVKELGFLNELEHLESLKVHSLEDNSYLKDLRSLKSLEIRFNNRIGEGKILSELNSLESLSLTRARTIFDLDFLSNMPDLKRFGISDSEISDLSLLTKLQLEELELKGNLQLKDYSAISEMPTLKKLDIDVLVPEARVKFFSLSKLPQLKELGVASTWISRLGKTESIEKLRLYTGAWRDFYMEDIPKMPSLRELSFEDKGSLHHAEGLKRFEQLETVLFYKSQLQYFDLAQLFDHPRIQVLNFHDVEVFSVDVAALKPNYALQSLSIDHADRLYLIDPSSRAVQDKLYGFKDFPEIFTNLKGLKKLVIKDSGIKSTGFTQQMPNLTFFEIDGKIQYYPHERQ